MDKFPWGDGELAALTQSFDWASTSLGPSGQWPDTLKTAVSIILASNHPMFIWWGPDLIQFYNDAYRKTMGPERHPSALGQPGRKCWHEIWPIIGPQIESIMVGGPPTWHEDQLVPVTRHGKREDVWWTYGFSPIRDSNGVRGVLVVCTDVTTEHLAREEVKSVNKRLTKEIKYRLHEAERLKVLFQQAPGFMCILRGPQHIFEFANDAYMRLVGNREVLGRQLCEAVPEAAGQGFFELLDQVFKTGQPFFAYEVPLSLQQSPGTALTQLFIDFIYQPIIEADGAVSGIFVEGADVTEKKHAQDELRVSQERLKEGMVAARMTVWDWDLAKGKGIFSANAVEIFGAHLEKLERPWELLHPDDVMMMKSVCERAIADRGKFRVIVRTIHPQNGKISWSDIRGKVLSSGAASSSLSIRGITMDITERKQAEEKLREADRRKDEFLAMLAHELRNPLAPISAAAQLLRTPKIEEVHVKRASEIISRQVEHMTSLVDDLLDVARVTRGEVVLDKHPVDIKTLLTDALEQVSPLIKMLGHKLVLQQPEESLRVLGDQKRLVQVVVNLLNNAVKYTPKGGNILVRIEAHLEQVVLTVRDDGIGVEPDLLPRIFELFTQAKRSADRSQGGLGIGLSLVKSIAELHGGCVTVQSKGIGTGTEFTVMLPRHTELLAHTHFDGDMVVPTMAKRLRILIADDNKDATLMLSILLAAEGHETFVEHNGPHALERAHTEAPDICILDIGLPDMDGNEIATRLRSTGGVLQPILIAVTGYGQETDRKIAFEAGFDYYFVKPVDLNKLVALLATLGNTPRI